MFSGPEAFFGSITDYRRSNKNKIHKLSDIIFLILAATISGITDWVGMEIWAETKQAWLRKYIDLANGIPAHDTLRAVARLSIRWNLTVPLHSGYTRSFHA